MVWFVWNQKECETCESFFLGKCTNTIENGYKRNKQKMRIRKYSLESFLTGITKPVLEFGISLRFTTAGVKPTFGFSPADSPSFMLVASIKSQKKKKRETNTGKYNYCYFLLTKSQFACEVEKTECIGRQWYGQQYQKHNPVYRWSKWECVTNILFRNFVVKQKIDFFFKKKCEL